MFFLDDFDIQIQSDEFEHEYLDRLECFELIEESCYEESRDI